MRSQLADARGLPVVVGFGLMDDYPEANLRHYRFMLEGLRETAAELERRGIRFVLRRGQPREVALALAERGGAGRLRQGLHSATSAPGGSMSPSGPAGR